MRDDDYTTDKQNEIAMFDKLVEVLKSGNLDVELINYADYRYCHYDNGKMHVGFCSNGNSGVYPGIKYKVGLKLSNNTNWGEPLISVPFPETDAERIIILKEFNFLNSNVNNIPQYNGNALDTKYEDLYTFNRYTNRILISKKG